jgi:CMP-N,N'-diacetyllegionaminic acid synthase
MKILTIVPARAGSVRLPNKNLRLLGGRPLIEWTVEFAKNLLFVSDILVSTDSSEIAQHAKKAGSLVPWLRPSNLSDAKSKSEDVVDHALNWYEKNVSNIDGVLLLQPTSPFRNIESVNTQIKGFQDESDLSIIGVFETTNNPIWELAPGSRFLSKVVPGERVSDSRTFSPCGNFYLTSKKEFKDAHSFFGARTKPFVVTNSDELVDIDTLEDFEEAERLLAQTSYPY